MDGVLESDRSESDAFVFSYTTDDSPFSNWSAHPIEIWGKTFPTAEHAYQYKKFEKSNPKWAEKILSAKSAPVAKRLGKMKPISSETWDKKRVKIMREIIFAKLSQHKDVQKALKETGDLAIIEKGGNDKFWGIGRDLKGKNVAGKIWMSLRS